MQRTPHLDNYLACTSTSRVPYVKEPSPHALYRHFSWSSSPPWTLMIDTWHFPTSNRGWVDWGDDLRWDWSRHGPLLPSSRTFSANYIGHLGPKSTLYQYIGLFVHLYKKVGPKCLIIVIRDKIVNGHGKYLFHSILHGVKDIIYHELRGYWAKKA